MAESCAWRTRFRAGVLQVAPEEYFAETASPLFTAERLVDASNARDPSAYEPFPAQLRYGDIYRVDEDLYRGVIEEVRRIAEQGGTPANWQAMGNLIRTTPDNELAGQLHSHFSSLVETFPDASLWLLSVSPLFEMRRAAIRVMFGLEHLPEDMERRRAEAPSEFEGIRTARDLRSDLHIQTLIDAFLVSQAPWTVGVSFERFGGAVVILFGKPQGSEQYARVMTDLHRVSYNSALSHEVLEQPRLRPQTVEAAFVWWVKALASMYRVVVDVSRFCTDTDEYRPEQHYGALLSLERLAASITTMLVYYRRDEFVRRMLMYDAADLLRDGLRMGDFPRLFNRRNLEEDIAELDRALAGDAAAMLLPRAGNALRGLAEMEEGFFVRDRVSADEIRLPHRRAGQADRQKSLPLAVAQYIHVLRDSNHGFRKSFQQRPDRLALFSMHSGRVPDVVSDVPWLHFLRLLAFPETALNGLGLRARLG